jgi:hypothetical protein
VGRNLSHAPQNQRQAGVNFIDKAFHSKNGQCWEIRVMDSRYADEIVKVAQAEAQPSPYGKVNDLQRIYAGGRMTEERFGWQRLKEYFEVAAKFTDQHWKIPGYLDGVRVNNKRVPVNIQWCGIFATWAWITAGVPGIKWALPGIVGPNVKKVAGSAGIAKGDIGVLTGDLVHHFVVADINGTSVTSINGNSLYQGITVKTNKLSEISYYYTVYDAFYEYLSSVYGQ